jgi:DNA-binding XRE family transcriptional regulator
MISSKKLLANTIPLEELFKDETPEERAYIEQEKKYYDIVVALYARRKKLKLSQQELAKKAKVPRTTISKIESGSRNVTLGTMMSIAQAMDSRIAIRLLC